MPLYMANRTMHRINLFNRPMRHCWRQLLLARRQASQVIRQLPNPRKPPCRPTRPSIHLTMISMRNLRVECWNLRLAYRKCANKLRIAYQVSSLLLQVVVCINVCVYKCACVCVCVRVVTNLRCYHVLYELIWNEPQCVFRIHNSS
jgi:hypothetical protein